MNCRWTASVLAMGLVSAASAQEVHPFEQSQDDAITVEEDLLNSGGGQAVKIYGFIDAYFEKVGQSPVGVDGAGNTVKESNPHEFDVANFNIMVQGTLASRFRYFVNLAAPGAGSSSSDEGIGVRNAWVEMPIAGDYLQLRAGKTYRRFGLYNEILDATPTFLGIEPPELFDADHLLVTRTTNLMLHGQISSGESTVSYALMTGNDERAANEIPIGFDLNWDWGAKIKLGTSFYTTAGDAAPTRGVGAGSPRGGVLNWMASDQYFVVGGYGQVNLDGFTLEAAFWHAPHKARRDPDAVLALQEAGLNARQRQRFGLSGDAPTASDVVTDVEYAVSAGYLRTGFGIDTKIGQITPYAQIDFYTNEETIQNKRFGGDNEAGLSDDGSFTKPTIGVVIRPDDAIALKVDGSTHIQKFNGETVQYPEVRVSLSYFWQLEGL